MTKVLSENSTNEYARIIKAIESAGFKDDSLDSLKAYFDFEGVIPGKKGLKCKYGIPSRITTISACINKHKANISYCKELREYADNLRKEHQKLTEDQKMTAKQAAKHIPWDQVLEKAVEAINNEKYSLEERILIALYTQLQPVRLDYTHIKLYDTDPKLNKGTYFIINDEVKEVVINEHKTAWDHKIGAIRQPLPERLAEMIQMWFKDETEMFPIAEAAFSKRIPRLFKKVTGKPMTVCALRHSRDTFLYEGSLMPKEAKTIAKAMGHSVATAQSYRFAPQ